MRSAFHNWVDIINSIQPLQKFFYRILLTMHLVRLCKEAKRFPPNLRECGLASYRQLVTSESFLTLWCTVLNSSKEDKFLPLFSQVVTRKLMMDEVVQVVFPMQETGTEELQGILKADEEQALRYAAGYVLMKLPG